MFFRVVVLGLVVLNFHQFVLDHRPFGLSLVPLGVQTGRVQSGTAVGSRTVLDVVQGVLGLAVACNLGLLDLALHVEVLLVLVALVLVVGFLFDFGVVGLDRGAVEVLVGGVEVAGDCGLVGLAVDSALEHEQLLVYFLLHGFQSSLKIIDTLVPGFWKWGCGRACPGSK